MVVDVWKIRAHLENLIKFYENHLSTECDDIHEKLNSLKYFIKNNNYSKFNYNKYFNFCRERWKELIERKVFIYKKLISNRKTRGSEFSEIITQLNKLKEDVLIQDLYLDNYENMYEEDLKSLGMKIKEKIGNERYDLNKFFIGLVVGGIIGFVVGLILNVL